MSDTNKEQSMYVITINDEKLLRSEVYSYHELDISYPNARQHDIFISKKDPRIIIDCVTDKPLHREYVPIEHFIKEDGKSIGYTSIHNLTSLTFGNKTILDDAIVTCRLKHKNKIYFTYKSTAIKNGFLYDPVYGMYFHPDYVTLDSLPKYDKNSIKYAQFDNTFSIDDFKDPINQIKTGVKSPSYLVTEGLTKTFGVELETSSGIIHKPDYHNLNIKCVYDGSLKDEDGRDIGGEYVTGILVGDAGFSQLNNICKILSKKCGLNRKCGVHVHIGINPTKSFIVNLYLILRDIENDIFKMMPVSRRNGPHSKKLFAVPSLKTLSTTDLSKEINKEFIINSLFDEIYKIVKFGGEDDGYINGKFTKHPMGDKCGYKKETPRYCWANFVTALFIRDSYKGNLKDYKGFTIEFRPHPASLNFTKIRNWVKICMAIVHYAENKDLSVLASKKTTLTDIIGYCYKKSSPSLLKYIEDRTRLFSVTDDDKEEDSLDPSFIENVNILNKKLSF